MADLHVVPGSESDTVEQGLSEARIIAEAVRILDCDGTDGLSMRRLADALGCRPMSLYWHIPSKEKLLGLAADAVFPQAISLPGGDHDWRANTVALVGELRRTLLAHPWLVAGAGAMPTLGANIVAFGERLLSVLKGAGLQEADLDGAVSALLHYTLGCAAAEESLRRSLELNAGAEEKWNAFVDEQMSGSAASPNLVTYLTTANSETPSTRFHRGLLVILRGIDSQHRFERTPIDRALD